MPDSTFASIFEGRRSQPHQLIEVLQDVQEQFGHIPEEAMTAVSNELGVPLVDVYSVASFYKAFSLKPQGKNVITVCTGTACHVRGGKTILKLVKQHLDVDEGETTPDLEYTLETVACIGVCALAPNMVVADHVHGHMNPKKVEQLFKNREGGR